MKSCEQLSAKLRQAVGSVFVHQRSMSKPRMNDGGTVLQLQPASQRVWCTPSLSLSAPRRYSRTQSCSLCASSMELALPTATKMRRSIRMPCKSTYERLNGGQSRSFWQTMLQVY